MMMRLIVRVVLRVTGMMRMNVMVRVRLILWVRMNIMVRVNVKVAMDLCLGEFRIKVMVWERARVRVG